MSLLWAALTCQLSAHVTRILGQNPGVMTLQGTNSYLLQPPSNPMAPIILVDTSSPHTARDYVNLLFTHLLTLGLHTGLRETHFESKYADITLKDLPEDQREAAKARLVEMHANDPDAKNIEDLPLKEFGEYATYAPNATKERGIPPIEHIILTHRHLDHVGALPCLLTELKERGMLPPKIWKLPNPDEAQLALNERDAATTDGTLWEALPKGTYHPMSPLQPMYPIMPGLMISILDPNYKHLLKHDKEGKPRWNEVPEVARVSVRCLKTPGHTQDSVSLVLCEGEKGVFTGDTVLGAGTAMFTDLTSCESCLRRCLDDTDQTDMQSLKMLLALKPNVLYPAHGPHVPDAESSAAHLNGYITHRLKREDEIISTLRSVKSDPAFLPARVKELFAKFKEEAYAKAKYEHEMWVQPAFDADRTEGKDLGTLKPFEGSKAHGQYLEQEKGREAELERDGKPETRFGDVSGLSVAMLTRLLYRTKDEKLIWAAGKNVSAHLVKLEQDGKVKRETVRMCRILDEKVVGPDEQEIFALVE